MPILRTHIIELADALDPAREALDLPPANYTVIAVGNVTRAEDVTRLRDGVR